MKNLEIKDKKKTPISINKQIHDCIIATFSNFWYQEAYVWLTGIQWGLKRSITSHLQKVSLNIKPYICVWTSSAL
jgi:hypothetical protein